MSQENPNNPTNEEEVVLTPEEQAAADEAAYNAVYFDEKEEENGEPKDTKKPNEEADQGSEAGESGEPTGDAESAAAEAGSEEAGNHDEAAAEGDPDPDADPKPDEGAEVASTSKLKWKGQEIEVSEDEKTALAQKGFDYTANMQQIAKFRKNIEAAGIDENVIQIMARAKAGDKTAYLDLLQMNEIDPTDLIGIEKDENFDHTLQKTENDIVPSEEVAPLIEQIRSNPELQSRMEQAEVDLPRAVINRIATDVNALYMTVGEVESGSFNQVMPRVNARLATLSDFDREAVLNNPDFFVAIYAEEKQRIGGGSGVVQGDPEAAAEKPSAAQPQVTPKKKPNMAAVGVKKPTQVNPKDVIDDAFNASDDDFQKIRQRVLSQR